MSADLPAWLAAAQPRQPETPAWLRTSSRPERTTQSAEAKAYLLARYELVFPRVLDAIYGGSTLTAALRNLPGEYGGIEFGSFMRWLSKDPTRKQLYKEAKEIRSEAYTGRMIELAEGGEDNPVELERAKFCVETYKWLVSRENRKDYGDTKTLEVNQNISIVGALEAARSRLGQVVDVELLDDPVPLMLNEAVDDEYDEGDED